MTDQPASGPGATLEQLDAQAAALRAELARLRSELDAVQNEFTHSKGAQLLEANERLVLAAMLAVDLADTAASNLDEVTRASQHDTLTGVANRVLMEDRLTHAIAIARRRQQRMAVLFVDIDKFKRINDTLGHAAGDVVLRKVAQCLQDVVRDSDTVSRYGGDEFLLAVGDVNQRSDVALVADKILAIFDEPVNVDGHLLRLSVSLGIALFPDDGDTVATLVAGADAAMYQAKRAGGGGYAFHGDAEGDGAGVLATTPADGRVDGMRQLRSANEQLVLSVLAANEMEAIARESHQRQVHFLAMVAHELRNPLAPLGAAAELMGRAGADEAQIAKLQGIIRRQVAFMSRLVDDLLEGARVGRGAFRLQRGPVDMNEVLALAGDTCRAAVARREQQFSMDVPGHLPPMVGDAVRLAQVFSNLLDNATKYTPRGGTITLTVRCSPSHLVASVTDTGIGLVPEALGEVFGLFVQDRRSATPHADGHGLGIGLAVVRDLVEAHGGTVVATSDGLGQGATFTVTLPIHDSPDMQAGVA